MTIVNFRFIYSHNCTSDTKILRFEPVDSPLFSFVPGQFVFLHILDPIGKSIAKKPYSIASDPSENYLEFCIKMINGSVTSHLDKLKIGDVVGIEGPLGHFTFNDDSDSLFLAGGTGIAPIMSMLRNLSKTTSKHKQLFFYSVKDFNSILYSEELKKLQSKNPPLKVIITLTRDGPPNWSGEKGRINKEMIEKYIPSSGIKNYRAWTCGPLEMIKTFKEALISLNINPKNLKMEGWG